MAYNKTKHLNAAQKYLQQGKMPQAIAEYQHILKNEPKDQVTLMTLGDLFVRQGETFQALEYFERLAKIFSTYEAGTEISRWQARSMAISTRGIVAAESG